MTRSTFRVLFYANGSKEKNGIVPIMGRVKRDGGAVQLQTEHRKGALGCKGQPCQRQERGSEGDEP